MNAEGVSRKSDKRQLHCFEKNSFKVLTKFTFCTIYGYLKVKGRNAYRCYAHAHVPIKVHLTILFCAQLPEWCT